MKNIIKNNILLDEFGKKNFRTMSHKCYFLSNYQGLIESSIFL